MSSYLCYRIEVKQGDKWIPVIFNGSLYTNSKQGMIRDHLSSRGWYNCPFTSRGLPDDVSQEVKESVEKYEYNYDISYATLAEFEDYYNTVEATYKQERSRVANEYMLRQLKYVLNKDVDDPEYMDLRTSFDEDLEDSEDSLFSFNRFIGEVYGIAEAFNNDYLWANENKVRIIFFLA